MCMWTTTPTFCGSHYSNSIHTLYSPVSTGEAVVCVYGRRHLRSVQSFTRSYSQPLLPCIHRRSSGMCIWTTTPTFCAILYSIVFTASNLVNVHRRCSGMCMWTTTPTSCGSRYSNSIHSLYSPVFTGDAVVCLCGRRHLRPVGAFTRTLFTVSIPVNVHRRCSGMCMWTTTPTFWILHPLLELIHSLYPLCSQEMQWYVYIDDDTYVLCTPLLDLIHSL